MSHRNVVPARRDAGSLQPIAFQVQRIDLAKSRPLRANERSGGDLASDVLDALPDATAVLDSSGAIVAVNHAWHMFAVDNGGDAA